MKHHRARIAVPLTLAVVVAGLLGTSPSQASSEATLRRAPSVISGRSHLSPHRDSFWTREKLRSARPISLPSGPARSARINALPRMESPARAINGTSPVGARTSSDTFSSSETLHGAPLLFSSSSSGPIPYASYEVTSDYRTYPYSTVGKIFMLFDGEISSCSGTAIASANKSVVWTAGHCVYGTRIGWVDDLIFVPAYKDGDAPLGIFPIYDLVVPQGWIDYENWADDQAAVVVGPNSAGQSLTDVVGSRGIQWNVDPVEFQAFGYPGEPEPKYNGERMIVCESPYGGAEEEYFGGFSILIGCDMEFGASGGGWVDATGRVNSNVSHGQPGSEVMKGPYFDDITAAVYDAANRVQVPNTTPQPTVTPGPVEPPEFHVLAIGLQLRKHLVAKGRMTAADGYTPCTVGAPVGVFRKTSSGWRLLKVVYTNEFGQYRVKLRDRTGRYSVYSPEGFVDPQNECSEAVSLTRIHRH